MVFGNPYAQDEPFAGVDDCAAQLRAADSTMTVEESLTWATLMSGSRRDVTPAEFARQRRLAVNAGRGLQN